MDTFLGVLLGVTAGLFFHFAFKRVFMYGWYLLGPASPNDITSKPNHVTPHVALRTLIATLTVIIAIAIILVVTLWLRSHSNAIFNSWSHFTFVWKIGFVSSALLVSVLKHARVL